MGLDGTVRSIKSNRDIAIVRSPTLVLATDVKLRGGSLVATLNQVQVVPRLYLHRISIATCLASVTYFAIVPCV
jgi:hypothetical protein